MSGPRGIVDRLTPEQLVKALAYDGPVNSGMTLAEMKAASRADNERRMAEGVSPEQINRENAFIPAAVARAAKIVGIGWPKRWGAK